MGDRMVAVALVLQVAVPLYAALTLAERACLRRSRWHRRYATLYVDMANGFRRMAAHYVTRAEQAAGVRARAFYRAQSAVLPAQAARHDNMSSAHAMRARVWEFLS